MKKILNIVNSDAIIDKMREAGVVGSFLPWNDFLHVEPVLESLSLESLSKVRAKYISKRGLGEFKEIYQKFKNRDATLTSLKKYEKIILWFENDLYDQLQLIQILDWFAKNRSTDTKIYIIYPDNYLGRCTTDEFQNNLLYNIEDVTHNHLITARKAWSAFSSKTPQAWYKLLDDDISTLPFLEDAVRRMLEEYPNTTNGLSRTEHQALIIISNGINNPQNIFEKNQKNEERAFMGDILFWDILKGLVESNLLNSTQNGQNLEITTLGKEILNGKKNWLKLNSINRWIGGVRLTHATLWCWDIKSKKILKYNYSSTQKSMIEE